MINFVEFKTVDQALWYSFTFIVDDLDIVEAAEEWFSDRGLTVTTFYLIEKTFIIQGSATALMCAEIKLRWG